MKDWDFTHFSPAFRRHFETRVGQLRDMGIEADIIIFHPYDRWGCKNMGHENNLFYLRYLVARLAAYRNVWWSLANEYDLLKWPMEHWNQYMKSAQEIDPYDHLPYQEVSPDFSFHPAIRILAKRGDCYRIYFAGKKPVTLDLPGDRSYRLDAIDPWEMKVLPAGSAGPGPFSFPPPQAGLRNPADAIRPGREDPSNRWRRSGSARRTSD